MKTKTEKTQESEQTDGKEFARFDSLIKRLMSVPKKEIDEKTTEYEARKAAKVTKTDRATNR